MYPPRLEAAQTGSHRNAIERIIELLPPDVATLAQLPGTNVDQIWAALMLCVYGGAMYDITPADRIRAYKKQYRRKDGVLLDAAGLARLKAAREQIHHSQRMVAEIVQVHVSLIGQLEQGAVKINPDLLEQLAHLYGVTTQWLLTGEGTTE